MSEVEIPSVQDLIQAALNQDYNHANDVFGNLMGEKMSDALEQEKIAIANQIYNGEEPEEDIDDIADETDEELEDDDELEEDE